MARNEGSAELERLEEANKALTERIETLTLGLRYRRREKQSGFATNVRRARRYLELALEMLAWSEPDSEEDLDDSWLLSRVAELTGNLMSGVLGSKPEMTDAEKFLSYGDTETVRNRDWNGFRGDTGSISIPDILQMIQMQAQSGILSVQLDDEMVQLEFEEGQIVHAFSRNSPAGQRLGEILVERGAISEEELKKILERLRAKNARFGDAVREEQVVEESELRAALDQQMQSLFHRLIASGSATYEFREGLEDATPDRANVNLTLLLLDSTRALDERASSLK